MVTREQAPAPEPPATKPLTLGRYTLIRPLGAGGMAVVWLAHKPIAGGVKACALKMPPDLVGADPRLRAAVLNEVRIASMLSHSNIVQVYDAGEIHGILYIEMEAIDGMDLGQMLEFLKERQVEMSVAMAVYITRAILEGLHYAHTFTVDGKPMGIVHRDLTPQNVLVSSSGEIKIMDFGIGKVEHEHTSGMHIRGKLRYMAPEQALGQSSPSVDLFAVGAILYEMLMGGRFREAGSMPEMMRRAATEHAPSLERTDVPPILVSFYERLVAHEKADRFANAAEALVHLAQWQGAQVFAQDVRTFYQRQLLRARRSGLSRNLDDIPPAFWRLVEALKQLNVAGDSGTPGVPGELGASPSSRLGAQAGQSANDAEVDAPSVIRRSSAVGNAAARGASVAGGNATTVDLPPPDPRWHAPRGGAASPAGVPAAVVAAADAVTPHEPLVLSPAAAPPRAAAPRHPQAAAPTMEPTEELPPFGVGSRPTPDTARPRSMPTQHDAVDRTARRRARPRAAALAGGLMLVATVATSITVAYVAYVATANRSEVTVEANAEAESRSEVGGEANGVSGLTAHAAKRGDGDVAAPTPPRAPMLESGDRDARPRLDAGAPVPTAPLPAPTGVVVPDSAPSHEFDEDAIPNTDATPAVSPAASSAAVPESPTPKPVAKPKPKPKPKAMVDVRIGPNFFDGELKIGKRTWVVTRTFNVPLEAGRPKIAWRKQGDPTWRPDGEILLDPTKSYFILLGSTGPAVSSKPKPPANPTTKPGGAP